MIEIKILGAGCHRCQCLEALVRQVIQANQIEAQVEKVDDCDEIMKWRILSTPGLVINDRLVSAGRIPGEAELLSWLKPPAPHHIG